MVGLLEALELEHFPGLCERQIMAMAQRLQQEHLDGADFGAASGGQARSR